MRQWIITWHSGKSETIEAEDYAEAHRKAHNRANWTHIGPVYSIALYTSPEQNHDARARAITLYRALMGGEVAA